MVLKEQAYYRSRHQLIRPLNNSYMRFDRDDSDVATNANYGVGVRLILYVMGITRIEEPSKTIIASPFKGLHLEWALGFPHG